MTNQRERLDKEVIQRFWEVRADGASTRWTASKILTHELCLLKQRLSVATSVLDLGCGSGDLSRELTGGQIPLTAVDQQSRFARFFTAANEEFVTRDVLEYSSSCRFGLVLLFGVITYLEVDEEASLYRSIAYLTADDGTAVIKNQCATAEELIVNSYSAELGAAYSARYPNEGEQLDRLSRHFAMVERYDYPAVFSTWPDTSHVAFFCSEPLRPSAM